MSVPDVVSFAALPPGAQTPTLPVQTQSPPMSGRKAAAVQLAAQIAIDSAAAFADIDVWDDDYYDCRISIPSASGQILFVCHDPALLAGELERWAGIVRTRWAGEDL